LISVAFTVISAPDGIINLYTLSVTLENAAAVGVAASVLGCNSKFAFGDTVTVISVLGSADVGLTDIVPFSILPAAICPFLTLNAA
jgi:hypothetical protein